MLSQIHPVTEFAARLRGHILEDIAMVEPRFERLALELFSAQFALNAAYRRIAVARGATPASIQCWQDIPAVPTSAFKEIELSCVPAAARVGVFHSSGTTAQRPSRHFHSAESLELYETSALAWFERNVPGQGDATTGWRLASLTPPPAQAPHSSLVHMFEVVRRELGAPVSAFLGRVGSDGAWTLDLDSSLVALQEACRSPAPLLLLGTAFSFVHLLDYLAERNLRLALPPGSRVMETGGYKGRSRALPQVELHALITQRLGVPGVRILREYGMSELSSQAYDRGGDGVFNFPPWARARVISPETGAEVAEGETGLLRIYDLANAYSVLAIQTEDLAVRRGPGFALVGRAQAAEPRGCSLAAA